MPALTLNRKSLATVYVGRQGCGAEAGKTTSPFQPTQGGEIAIDPSIITQLLEPIPPQREQDGNSIFDGFGDIARQRVESPDEVLMICLDSSQSMYISAGFIDVDAAGDEDVFQPTKEEILLQGIVENEVCTDSLETAKELLNADESFQDIILTIPCTQGRTQIWQSTARKLFKCLISGKLQELMSDVSKLEALGSHSWGFR